MIDDLPDGMALVDEAQLALLDALTTVFDRDGSAPVAAVAAEAGLPMPTAYGLLLELRDLGLAEPWPTSQDATMRPTVTVVGRYEG